MITLDLIEYIKSQLNKNVSKSLIITTLSDAGWRLEDIEEGFLNITNTNLKPKIETSTSQENQTFSTFENLEKKEEIKKTIDPYREIPEEVDTFLEVNNTPNNNLNEKPIEKTIEESSPIKLDKIEESKIWTPKNIEPKIIENNNFSLEEKTIINKDKIDLTPKIEKLQVEAYPLELSKGGDRFSDKSINQENKTQSLDQQNIELGNDFLPKKEDIDLKENIKPSSEIPSPSLINKTPVSSLSSQSINQPNLATNINQPTAQGNVMSDILPKKAMISSYSQDSLSSQKKDEATPSGHKKKILKWSILIIFIVLVSGMVFAFVEGYIKIPGTNFSFFVVKKDPKILILNAPSVISNFKSYKVETRINISSPALSNITTGLSSGEVVTSRERDSISINSKGLASHIDGKLFFDYFLTFKSSILKDDIISHLKYDGNNLFISIPDLKQILKKDTPHTAIVSFEPNQLGLIIPEFSTKTQDIINKIDTNNIISKDFPENIKKETVLVFKEFIESLNYSEKNRENINGVDTYQYVLTANRPATKKFLTALADVFLVELPLDQKNNLEEALGASSITSFNVWVGKNDHNIYQIKFTLTAPLSRLLGLNDSGIAGNEVTLDWVTTYSDIEVENNIIIPTESISIEKFINNIKETKIKNIASSFPSQAISLSNAIGSFGKKPNTSGSCINPTQGSLFSPLGHTKGSESAVGAISNTMNLLLEMTNKEGSCYSTTKAWSLSLPLSKSTNFENNSFYCLDSTGAVITLPNPVTGVICSNEIISTDLKTPSTSIVEPKTN